MKRDEALDVLHEILIECKESIIIDCVSLDPKESGDAKGCDVIEIRAKCDLDDYSRSIIKPILDKHQLAIKEEKGFVILFSKI